MEKSGGKEKRIKEITNTLQVLKVGNSLFPKGEGKNIKGSITVETALTLPFLLLIWIGFLHWIPVMQFYAETQLAMEELSQNVAVYSYGMDLLEAGLDLPEKDEQIAGVIQQGVIPGIAYELIFRGREAAAEKAGVKGVINTGFSTLDLENQWADVVVKYRIRLPGFPFPMGGMDVVQRSGRRLWTGRSLCAEGSGAKEEMVYITKNGRVYHRDRFCPYLSISLEYHSMEAISEMRNADGEIYRPCESCNPSESDGGGFIASYGNRYHSRTSCPALVRNIDRVPISQAVGMGPCHKCGIEAK